MAYAAWSVIAGEQPTTSKWNILGTNDAAFNDGTGVAALTIGATTAVKNSYKFSVYRNAALNTGTGFNVVTHDTKTYDTGTNVDVVTNKGRFTAPVAGFYQFSWAAGGSAATGAGGANNFQTALYKNSAIISQGSMADMRDSDASGNSISQGADTIQLAANDFVEVYARCNAGAVAMAVGPAYNRFAGFLVSAT